MGIWCFSIKEGNSMAVTQYIGARYVPIFFTNPDDNSNDWRSGIIYDPLTIVTYLNQSYTSKIPVPASVGNPADNPQYWALTGAYNAQVAQCLQDVEELDGNVQTLSDDVDDLGADIGDFANIVPIMGVLRKTADGWSLLSDSGHQPMHLDAVTLEENGYINIAFDQTFSKVGAITVVPDEEYAKMGWGCGSSIGLSQLQIRLIHTRMYGGMFDFSGTTPSLLGGSYDGDIKAVTYNQAGRFEVEFQDYVGSDGWSTWNAMLQKADMEGVEIGSQSGFISTNKIAVEPKTTLAGKNGRCLIQAGKMGSFVSANDIPVLNYTNFWITGFMYR